jgi:hypoxanthine phosphoribosyltransferase
MNPYDYSTRKGVLPISWEYFHGICKALALAVSLFEPEIILPVGRGGYYPGTLLAHMMQLEIYPIRLSRRVNDVVVYDSPRWVIEPPAAIAGRRVLIVDEICSTGKTIRMVKEAAAAHGSIHIKSAVLYAHNWGVDVPDYIGLVSDALILNPWDREVLCDGKFQFHPEYAEALIEQGLEPEPGMLIPTQEFQLAKC